AGQRLVLGPMARQRKRPRERNTNAWQEVLYSCNRPAGGRANKSGRGRLATSGPQASYSRKGQETKQKTLANRSLPFVECRTLGLGFVIPRICHIPASTWRQHQWHLASAPGRSQGQS